MPLFDEASGDEPAQEWRHFRLFLQAQLLSQQNNAHIEYKLQMDQNYPCFRKDLLHIFDTI